jgi:hypothetical protein
VKSGVGGSLAPKLKAASFSASTGEASRVHLLPNHDTRGTRSKVSALGSDFTRIATS